MAGIGTKIKEVLVGSRGTEADLTQEQRNALARREALQQSMMQTLQTKGPTESEEATLQAGRNLADQLVQRARGRAAGARGFAKLAAEAEADKLAGSGVARVLSETAAAAGKARQVDKAQAADILARMSSQDVQIAEQAKREADSLGILPALLAAGGMAIGGAVGGKEGVQAGGVAGSGIGTAISQQFQ